VVETVLGDVGLLADVLLLLALSDGGGLLGEALLLLGLGLGTVLVEDLESLGGKVTVGNVLELGNRRWDLQAHVEDLLLALKTDIRATHHQYLPSAVDRGLLTASGPCGRRCAGAGCPDRCHSCEDASR